MLFNILTGVIAARVNQSYYSRAAASVRSASVVRGTIEAARRTATALRGSVGIWERQDDEWMRL